MSQQKVERNKERKANMKTITKQKRFRANLAMVLTLVVCIGICSWIGYSIYGKFVAKEEADNPTIQIDSSSINDYLTSLTEE